MKGRYNVEHMILIALFCICGYLVCEISRLHKKFDLAINGLIEAIGNNDRMIYSKLNDIEREIYDEKANRN